jgi:deoxyribodipyrimidine photo-lyase
MGERAGMRLACGWHAAGMRLACGWHAAGMVDAMPAVMWFRRDLRLADNPALVEACADGEVLPLFVLDPELWGPSGPVRRAYLGASLRSLDAALRQRGARLSVVRGDPVRRVVLAAREAGAERVHVAADFGPYGRARDELVDETLADAGVELVRSGSPYAVAPGSVTTGAGDPYRVFTPFSTAWADHGWPAPVDAPTGASWLELDDTTEIPDPALPDGITLPDAGEAVALRRWRDFLDEAVAGYDTDRDRPGVDGSSRMSAHVKWGEIHPRTMLADLARLRSAGAATYRKELAWREFYADVLFHRPETAHHYLRPEFARMAYDEPDGRLDAWRRGRTGFPIVDAGMRQLRATGWMHNRVRMIVASFLVKDLHLEWRHGAGHFMRWLVDGDLASNQHNWQWVAGCGTDAAPYFRVFNPTAQGRRFDPDGSYVRRWVPELAHAGDPHEPGEVDGYPAPIVDHAEERREALARWERIRG